MPHTQLKANPETDVPPEEPVASWEEFTQALADDAASVLFDSGKCPAGHEILHPESLSEEEVAVLERHLESCDRCAAVVLSTSVELDEAARVVALAVALADETPAASACLSGPNVLDTERQVELAPGNRFGTKWHDGEVVASSRQKPRRTIVDRFAGVGGLAVAAGAAVLMVRSFWEVQSVSLASGESQLIASAGNPSAGSVKFVPQPNKDPVSYEASKLMAATDQWLEAQRQLEAWQGPLAGRLLASTAYEPARHPGDSKSTELLRYRQFLASADQHSADLAQLLFDKSIVTRNRGDTAQANEIALKAFELQKSASEPPTLAVESLETLLPALIERRELETAEKLLIGASDREPLDPEQSRSLLTMFEIVYGSAGLNKPNELAAIRDRLTAAESQQEKTQAGDRGL